MAPCGDVLCLSAVSLLDSVTVAYGVMKLRDDRQAKNYRIENMNLKKGGHVVIFEKVAVKAIFCIVNAFSHLFYFLTWVLTPAAAGLLPTLRTGTFETGILVRGGSLA